jgi:hypothetical protein
MTTAVSIALNYLNLVEGETDTMYVTAKNIKKLNDREIGRLFTLKEFVQTGAVS